MIYLHFISREPLILQHTGKTKRKQIIGNSLVSKLYSKPSMHVIWCCWSIFIQNVFIQHHQNLLALEVSKTLAQLDGTTDSNADLLMPINILYVSVLTVNAPFISILIYFHLVQLYGYLLFELSYCCSIPVISHNPTD